MAFKEQPPFVPQSQTFLIDDFTSWANSQPSTLGFWSDGFGGPTGTAGHPGIITTNTTGSVCKSGSGDGSATTLLIGSGTYSINWHFNIPSLSDGTNRYQLYVGLGDNTYSEASNGIYFEYSDNINSGNWVLKSANGGSRTTQNSAVAVATGWQTCRIDVVNTTSATFYVNGTQIGTPVTTNLPASTTSFKWAIFNVAGSNPTLLLDLFYCTFTPTVVR